MRTSCYHCLVIQWSILPSPLPLQLHYDQLRFDVIEEHDSSHRCDAATMTRRRSYRDDDNDDDDDDDGGDEGGRRDAKSRRRRTRRGTRARCNRHRRRTLKARASRTNRGVVPCADNFRQSLSAKYRRASPAIADGPTCKRSRWRRGGHTEKKERIDRGEGDERASGRRDGEFQSSKSARGGPPVPLRSPRLFPRLERIHSRCDAATWHVARCYGLCGMLLHCGFSLRKIPGKIFVVLDGLRRSENVVCMSMTRH